MKEQGRICAFAVFFLLELLPNSGFEYGAIRNKGLLFLIIGSSEVLPSVSWQGYVSYIVTLYWLSGKSRNLDLSIYV